MISLYRNRAMLLIALLFLLCLGSGCETKKKEPLVNGSLAPDPGALYIQDDSQIKISDFTGSPLVILFYSISCCADELEKLEKLKEDLVTTKLNVLAINVGDPKDDVTELIHEKQVSYQLGYDPIRTSGYRYSLVGLPTFFTINGEGIVTSKLIGKMNYPQLKDLVQADLAKQSYN